LAFEATNLSNDVPGSEIEAYLSGIAGIEQFKKAGFLNVRSDITSEMDSKDLEDAQITGGELHVGPNTITAPTSELLVILRAALLATEEEGFSAQDVENILLPADKADQIQLASAVTDFAMNLKRTEEKVQDILEKIDEVMAQCFGLALSEHDTIRKRCQQFPLSVTVERPRYAWSSDRKSQARRVYKPGQRFK
jgi:hypothetical protein